MWSLGLTSDRGKGSIPPLPTHTHTPTNTPSGFSHAAAPPPALITSQPPCHSHSDLLVSLRRSADVSLQPVILVLRSTVPTSGSDQSHLPVVIEVHLHRKWKGVNSYWENGYDFFFFASRSLFKNTSLFSSAQCMSVTRVM